MQPNRMNGASDLAGAGTPADGKAGPIAGGSVADVADVAADTTPNGASIPHRYELREDDQGRYLTCLGAQNLFVRVDPKHAVSAAAAKRAPEGTVFLDGAAQGEPFMAVQQRIYNLDHHEGCVRAFTLATCEQAMVLVIRGLDLRTGEWTIRAGEPDLDTVLAIWVLLNHAALHQPGSVLRAAIMPVLRLEGVIDAHGLGMVDLCGFPPALLAATRHTIEVLRERELELKKTGEWTTGDPLEYVAEVLHGVDRDFYDPDQFRDYAAIEELARVQITEERMAILCRAKSGIYEVEESLREQHRDRLGVIVLQKNSTTYTLRQVDPFLPIGLDDLYARLNLLDDAVRKSNRWGGSGEIGGSPRTTGTTLSVQQIAEAIRSVYRPASLARRLWILAAGLGVALVGVVVALGLAAIGGWRPTSTDGIGLAELFARGWYAAALGAGAVVIFGAHASRGRRRYGAQAPANYSWAALAPIAILAGAGGGSWLAPALGGDGWTAILCGVPLAVAVELLFRGVIFGRLAAEFRSSTGWRISIPVAVAAALSATAAVAVFAPSLVALGGWQAGWRLALFAPSAIGLGLACGIARQRSESVLPAVALHCVAAITAAYGSAIGL